MRRENKETLRRLWEASHCNGAHNIVGLAYSIHSLGGVMLDAGWGTDSIAADPAIRRIAIALGTAGGIPFSLEYYAKTRDDLQKLRESLMQDAEYSKILEENEF